MAVAIGLWSPPTHTPHTKKNFHTVGGARKTYIRPSDSVAFKLNASTFPDCCQKQTNNLYNQIPKTTRIFT